MKVVTSTALSLIQQPTGTAPFFVVRVNWGSGNSYYSSKISTNFPSYNANVMDIGEIRNSQSSRNSCNVGSVSIQFSDTDGQMKFVIDNRVGERAPAALFLAFDHPGFGEADFIPLIIGTTSGPIEWNEKERTFRLEIETFIQSRDVGFVADQNDFANMNPEAYGVPWPMIFGTCAHVPALHFQKRATCYTQSFLRLYQTPVYTVSTDKKDITLNGNPDVYAILNADFEKNKIYVDDSSLFPQKTDIQIMINDVVFQGQFTDNHVFQVASANVSKFPAPIKVGPRDINDADNANYKVLWLDDSSKIVPIVNNHCYFQAPEGQEWYNYCIQQVGKKCWFRYPFYSTVKPFNLTYMTSTHRIVEVYGVSKPGMISDIAGEVQRQRIALQFRGVRTGTDPFGAVKSHLDSQTNDATSWWQASMDTEVKLWHPHDVDVYIASLIPMASIHSVYGKRRIDVNGKSKTVFVPIPTSYYTVTPANYSVVAGLVPTGLIFDPPLDEYTGQNWESDVFVSGTSTIGPNSVDIIKWLILNFTNMFVDAFAFNLIRGAVSGKPANFALFDKRDAVNIAKEIAYQSRCGLLFDLGGCGIVNLAVEPLPTAIFNESNAKNWSLGFVETKELVTRFIASYSQTYKDKHHLAETHELNIREFERVLRSLLPTGVRSRSETNYVKYYNNIAAFGLHTEESPAYIYNDPSSVSAFANFWGFRLSNVWRKVKFETWLTGTIIQPFDLVYLNLTDTSILRGSLVPAIVESSSFDPKTKVTTIDTILPIQAGFNLIAPLFWPG